MLENGIASHCVDHPGFDVDLYVETDVPTLYSIWRDQLMVRDASSSGRIIIEGDRALAHAFPTWFGATRYDYRPDLAGTVSA